MGHSAYPLLMQQFIYYHSVELSLKKFPEKCTETDESVQWKRCLTYLFSVSERVLSKYLFLLFSERKPVMKHDFWWIPFQISHFRPKFYFALSDRPVESYSHTRIPTHCVIPQYLCIQFDFSTRFILFTVNVVIAFRFFLLILFYFDFISIALRVCNNPFFSLQDFVRRVYFSLLLLYLIWHFFPI